MASTDWGRRWVASMRNKDLHSLIARFIKECSRIERHGPLFLASGPPDMEHLRRLILEQRDRLKIWAGNIGAEQVAQIQTSLQHRIRDAPEMFAQIMDLLGDLFDDLVGVIEIVTGARENRTETIPVSSDSNSSKDQNILQLSEVHELQESIADAITQLLRLSEIIRETRPRDRWAEAAASMEDGLAPQQISQGLDTKHVGLKFPGLEQEGMVWLKNRLGEAITQRRQFLSYCERRHYAFGLGIDGHHGSSHVLPPARPDSDELASDHPGSAGQGKASSLAASRNHLQKQDESESCSLHSSASSLATSFHGDDDEDWRLEAVSLKEVQKDDSPFECPYCHEMQTMTTQSHWERHVHADFKAYVCLFQNCESKMFSSRRVWFEHELSEHLSEWQCCYCSTEPFADLVDFEEHMETKHGGEFRKEQLSSLAKLSRRPLENIPAASCPFCDWPTRLRAGEISSQDNGSMDVLVPWRRYRKHVGGHLEQLALSALPIKFRDKKDGLEQTPIYNEARGPFPSESEEPYISPGQPEEVFVSGNRFEPGKKKHIPGTIDLGSRRKLANMLRALPIFPDRRQKQSDDSGIGFGRATDFPIIPGELYRNRQLSRTKNQYNQDRDTDEAPMTMSPGHGQLNDPPSYASPAGNKPRKRRDTLEVPPLMQFPSRKTQEPGVSNDTTDIQRLWETLPAPPPIAFPPRKNQEGEAPSNRTIED